ncbi:MAG TPA: ATP-binding protein, partial [Methanomassiliicoccales archaeon]|nr:ATP-binding protein [Methanomassiliicoccales archaeon]
HDIPDLVSNEAEWRNVEGMVRTAFHFHDLGSTAVECDLKGLEVFTDKMFVNIFFNLADNSLRHAEGLKRIRLGHRVDGEDLFIVFEDDGVGIPQEQKELIFERGYGKNTGLGLYLAREIASLTGIKIIENGVSGARFEMRIPGGKWRRG